VLRGFGQPVSRAVEAYCDSPFELAGLDRLSFPLAEEPHLADWRRYASEAGVHLVPYLRSHLPQLSFPIRDGISGTDAYRRAIQQGEPVKDAVPEEIPALEPDALRLEIHDHLAGALPVLIAATRADFETAYRALAGRSEPVPLSPGVNAHMISGLVNWDRIGRARATWAEGRSPAEVSHGWADEMRRLTSRHPERLADRLILLCDAPYGGQPASAFGFDLDESEWRRVSSHLRVEHEFTHYATHRLYGRMRLNLLDELMADAMGMTAALGTFKARWFTAALGLGTRQVPGPDARVHTYRAGLTDEEFALVCAVATRAAGTVEACTLAVDHHSARGRYLLALTGMTLDGLASERGRDLFDAAWVHAGWLLDEH
jgi:hypothetical protein